MSKKSIKINYVYNLVYQILTILIPLITTPYISRVIGAEGIGVYSFTYSIAAYFTVFAALGSNTYAKREIAYRQDDVKDRSIIFWEIILLRLFSTILCLILYLIVIIYSNNKIISLIQMIYIINVFFDITWYFQGIEDFKKMTIINIIIKIINVLFIFIFVKNNEDLLLYIAGLAIIPTLGNIVSWILLIDNIEIIRIKRLCPLKHLNATIQLFIPTIAAQIYLLLDKVMLGFFTTTSIENGYYEQSQKIIKICWAFITTFAAVIAPRIAYLYKKNDIKSMKNYINKSFNAIWLISLPISFGLFSVTDNFVPWFFGDEFIKVISLLKVFSWIVIPIGISSIIGYPYLITINKIKPYTISILVGAATNLVLNILLIPKLYSVGAAIASLIAEIVVATYQVIYVAYYDDFISIKNIFCKIPKYLISSVLMSLVLIILSGNMLSSIANTIILVILGVILYFILLLLMKDDLLYYYFNKIKKVFIKYISNIYYKNMEKRKK